MRHTLPIVLLLMAAHVGSGQSAQLPTTPDDMNHTTVITQRGQATEVAPGITVIIDPEARTPLELATEIHYFPHFLEAAIPYDKDYETFQIEFASRIRTRLFLEVDQPDLVARVSDVVVPVGVRMSVGFAAFGAHAGLIKVYNEERELIAEIPYNITKQSRLQQTVSGFVTMAASSNFDTTTFAPATIGASYQVSERSTGVSASLSVEYNTENILTGRATVTGAYSW